MGSSVYFEHPTADIICLAYDLKDGRGRRRWKPGDPNPADLIAYLSAFSPDDPVSYAQPGVIEAHNSGFELRCAIHVLHKKYGWPKLDLRQMRCSMSKARAFSLPGALGNLAEVLRLDVKKDKEGERLIKKFSCPRDPTKADKRTWILPQDDPADAEKYYNYNETDIVAEAGASARMPDLIPQELDYWLADQACNWRGVGVDLESVNACISVLDQAHRKYNAELYQITGGTVARASEISKLQEWVADCTGYRMKSGDSEAIEEAIQALYKRIDDGGNDIGDIMDYEPVIRALEIRNLIGSAAVKKSTPWPAWLRVTLGCATCSSTTVPAPAATPTPTCSRVTCRSLGRISAGARTQVAASHMLSSRTAARGVAPIRHSAPSAAPKAKGLDLGSRRGRPGNHAPR